MNVFEARYELERADGVKPAIRHGFCIASDRFMAKFRKTAVKKAADDRLLPFDLAADPNLTFFSEKGVRTIHSRCLSAWPVGQEPLNLAHWKAVIVSEGTEWSIVDSGSEYRDE